jgi:hypothetical protein
LRIEENGQEKKGQDCLNLLPVKYDAEEEDKTEINRMNEKMKDQDRKSEENDESCLDVKDGWQDGLQADWKMDWKSATTRRPSRLRRKRERKGSTNHPRQMAAAISLPLVQPFVLPSPRRKSIRLVGPFTAAFRYNHPQSDFITYPSAPAPAAQDSLRRKTKVSRIPL